MSDERFLGLTIRQFLATVAFILLGASLLVGGFAAGRVTQIAPVVDESRQALNYLCDTTQTVDALTLAATALVREQLQADLAAHKAKAVAADVSFLVQFVNGHRRIERNGACAAVTADTTHAP